MGLFRKKMEHSCAYCVHGTFLDKNTVLCCKTGVHTSQCLCSKFLYDPCKRVPAKAKTLDFKKYDQYDYSL